MNSFSLRFLLLAASCVVASGVQPVRAQTVYDGDGEPTVLEEEIRWLLNRARFDRARENAVRKTSYANIPARSGPLAPNASLTLAARRHSEDMARRNVFQHQTVPGSFFYNPSTQKQPWDRMSAEGYDWNLAGENIAAGYESAAGVYVAWWKSGKHRENMGDADFCEIGNGYYYRAASTYIEYYTMTLGRSWGARFFTDTLFHDANGNGTYTQGEGRAGVRVLLTAQGAVHPVCDVSAAAGSFAIPIHSLADGVTVQVVLENTTGAALTLSVPKNYDELETLVLGPGESRSWGTFTKTARNFGFRDLERISSYLTLTPGSRVHAAGGVESALTGIDANVAWTAQSNASWLRVLSGAAGEGEGVLTYAVDPHTFGDPRSAAIIFTGEDQATGTFTVTQQGVPAELAVTPSGAAAVPASGLAALAVQVGANVTWQAAEQAHWLEITGGQGVGAGDFAVKVAPNTGSAPREAVVTVSGGGLAREIVIAQEAGASPFVAELIEQDMVEGDGEVQRVTGLPPGLRWDKASGQVRGQATRAGSYTLKVDVRGLDGKVTRRLVTLLVQALPESAVGAFEARLARQDGEETGLSLGGELRLTTTRGGAASGTLRVQGRTHRLRGKLAVEAGHAPAFYVTIPRSKEEALELALELGPDHLCQGMVCAGEDDVEVTGWRRVWGLPGMGMPAGQTGRFHVLAEAGEAWRGDEEVPQGIGYGVLKVTAAGRVNWSGKLGDGSRFLRSGFLGPCGEAGFWSLLYRSKGSVIWEGRLDEDGGFAGAGDWVKTGPASAGERAYRRGFGVDERGPVGLGLTGERWLPPGPGQNLLDILALPSAAEWLIHFVHGVTNDTSASNPGRLLEMIPPNQFVLPKPGAPGNEDRLSVWVRPATGLATGGFELVDDHPLRPGTALRRKVKFEGLLLPGRRMAAGFFAAPKRPDRDGGTVKTDVLSGMMVLGVVETW